MAHPSGATSVRSSEARSDAMEIAVFASAGPKFTGRSQCAAATADGPIRASSRASVNRRQ